jgi:hypothetical protein
MARNKKEILIESFGEMYIILAHLAAELGSNLEECLEIAYNEIKNRSGKTVNGSFVKN